MRKDARNGITLIALVITIIVLLILAGVSISLVVGDNGVLNQATKSKNETAISSEKELINLAASGAMMKNENTLSITEENLETELNSLIGERDVDYILSKSGDYYIVKYTSSNRSYYIDSNTGENFEYIDYSYLFEFDATTGTILRVKKEYIGGTPGIDYYCYSDGSFSSYFTSHAYWGNYGWCKLKEDIDVLYIPSSINGVEVKNIENLGIVNVKKVIIEDGIENIEKLFTIDLGQGFTGGIGAEFLVEEIVFPDTIKYIGEYALNGCNNLKKINLP